MLKRYLIPGIILFFLVQSGFIDGLVQSNVDASVAGRDVSDYVSRFINYISGFLGIQAIIKAFTSN